MVWLMGASESSPARLTDGHSTDSLSRVGTYLKVLPAGEYGAPQNSTCCGLVSRAKLSPRNGRIASATGSSWRVR